MWDSYGQAKGEQQKHKSSPGRSHHSAGSQKSKAPGGPVRIASSVCVCFIFWMYFIHVNLSNEYSAANT